MLLEIGREHDLALGEIALSDRDSNAGTSGVEVASGHGSSPCDATAVPSGKRAYLTASARQSALISRSRLRSPASRVYLHEEWHEGVRWGPMGWQRVTGFVWGSHGVCTPRLGPRVSPRASQRSLRAAPTA